MLKKLSTSAWLVFRELGKQFHTYDQPRTTSFRVGMEWFRLINAANRRLLFECPNFRLLNLERGDSTWKIALNTLAAESSHRAHGFSEDLAALKHYYDQNIDAQGNWKTPIKWVDHIMQGYSLLYLLQFNQDARYLQAVNQLVESLLMNFSRESDGSFPYRTKSHQILVDTLAMICPFLARYSNQFRDLNAMDVSVNQLVQFVQNNVDDVTHLPYHGYYAADGPRRLGMHAWGRGTGWYVLGLIDTLVEMPKDHPDYAFLLDAYVAATKSLKKFQRDDGHWNWAILHGSDHFDSSTTSLIGYSVKRGIQAGCLDEQFETVAKSAIHALIGITRPDGLLDGSLAECQGLGKYPQTYRPTSWLQGAATAFAALSIDYDSHL